MAHRGDIYSVGLGANEATSYSLEGVVNHAPASSLSLRVLRMLPLVPFPVPAAALKLPANVRTVHTMGLAGVGDATRPYSIQGWVKEQGAACRRLIRAYRRDTGELLVSGYSDLPGNKFHLRWAGYSGQVFVVAFDDLGLNPDFNCRIYDLITPE